MEVWKMWDKIIPNQKTHKNPIIYDPLKVIGKGQFALLKNNINTIL